MRISDWSSDVCSSDLLRGEGAVVRRLDPGALLALADGMPHDAVLGDPRAVALLPDLRVAHRLDQIVEVPLGDAEEVAVGIQRGRLVGVVAAHHVDAFLAARSEEHTSELPSLMLI